MKNKYRVLETDFTGTLMNGRVSFQYQFSIIAYITRQNLQGSIDIVTHLRKLDKCTLRGVINYWHRLM